MVPVDDDDADTTAATTAPALGPPPTAVPHGADADDSTVQQLPSKQVLAAEARAGSSPDELSRETAPTARGPQVLAPAPARAPARRPMMTLLGTGPARSEPEDEEHESVTERAKLGIRIAPRTPSDPAIVRVPAPARPPVRSPSVATPSLPLPLPAAKTPAATPAVLPELPGPRGSQPEDDDADETEVRTVVEQVGPPPRALAEGKAGAAPPGATLPDAEQDSVTARAPAVRMPSFARVPVVTEKADAAREPSPSLLDPPTSPRAVAPNVPSPFDPPTSPVPAPNAPPVRPPAETQAADDLYDPEESVTTRGPPVDELEAQDVTEGTTKKLQGVASLPAEEEPESVTTQAPGHLTNMLRVIAAEVAPPAVDASEDDDDLPENKTAVMPNGPYAMSSRNVPVAAPVPARGGPSGPSPVHPQLALGAREHGSESALRVAEPPRAPIDHASLGAIALVPARSAHEAALAPPFVPSGGEGSTAPPPRAPRYGAVVALVAIVSLAAPVGVFYVLRGRTEEVAPGPRDVRTKAPEIVRRDDPIRSKAPPKTTGKRR